MLQTNDYRCKECGDIQTLLVDKEKRDELQPCPCGGEASRMFTAQVKRYTYPDGIGRWKSVKEKREYDKQIQKYRRDMRTGKVDVDTANAEIARLNKEKAQVVAKGRTKKAEIAPKGE